MDKLPIVNLLDHARLLGESGRRVSILWQDSESIAFIARGREYRSEFHLDPSDEVMYMIKGEMRLHWRAPDGAETVDVIAEGSTVFAPAGVPHSPRFSPDAFALIIERKRRPGEVDRFRWYCQQCDALLHEEACVVADYRADPVSKAYQRFFDDEKARTCKRCGAVMAKP